MLKLAWPAAFRGTLGAWATLSRTKVTVPVGAPAPGAPPATVAVKVTRWPSCAGLAEGVTAVVVFPLVTVRVNACAGLVSWSPLAVPPLSCSRTLTVALKTLNDDPSIQLHIEGYASPEGSPEYNKALGERRARAVRDYLTERGIAASRLTITSYGEERLKSVVNDRRVGGQIYEDWGDGTGKLYGTIGWWDPPAGYSTISQMLGGGITLHHRYEFADEGDAKKFSEAGLVSARYVEGNRKVATAYPANPNGSPFGIAAIRLLTIES